MEEERLMCCGKPLSWLIAESVSGRRHALCAGKGIPVRLWRCTLCERLTCEGWVPPTWISAVAREAERIRGELEAEIERAYRRTRG